LSQVGRSIGGNRIQFRRPGSQLWETLYQRLGQSQYGLHPHVKITDQFGVRAVHPVTKEKKVPHTGEDYDLAYGTELRVLGPGTMTPLANVGNAGNISRFTSQTDDKRPFTLEFMHLSELPKTQVATGDLPATGRPPAAPELPAPPTPAKRQYNFFHGRFNCSVTAEKNAR
jgi:hypothetical protein